jgi:hypothetical protein
MINEGPFDRYQLVISYELLKLLEWLIDHEQDNLRKLIKRAVHKELFIRPSKIQPKEEELQQNIVAFFAIVDAILHETISEDLVKNNQHRTLIPAINNVDSTLHNPSSISTSIAKATAAAEKKGQDPKEILCKELLKRWKPAKNASFH